MFKHLTAVENYPECLEALFSKCGLKVGKNVLSDLSKMTKAFKHSTDYVVFPSLTHSVPVSLSLVCLGAGLSTVDYNLQLMSGIIVPECKESDYVINEVGLIVTKLIPNCGCSCKSIDQKAPQKLWLNTASTNLFLAINPLVCVNEFGPNSHAISLGNGLRKGDKLPVGYSDGISTFYIVRGIHMTEPSLHAYIPTRLDIAS